MGLFPGACIVASDSLRLARAQPPTGKSKNNTPRKITTRFITVNWMKQQQFALDGEKQSAAACAQLLKNLHFFFRRLPARMRLGVWRLIPADLRLHQRNSAGKNDKCRASASAPPGALPSQLVRLTS